jgi:hypothetical protein
MRDTHPSPTTDRLPARLCHPCRDERIRALGLLFSDPAFLTRLDRRERVLARKYRWIGPRAEIGELRSIAFIRLSARLRKAPLWRDVPVDTDAWERYLNTLTRNVFRTAARSARRQRRRELAGYSRGQGCRAHATSEADARDPSDHTTMRDDLAQLERWASATGGSHTEDRARRAFRQLQCAYATGNSSIRDAARFIGTSHTEVRRMLTRARRALTRTAPG